MPFLRLTLNEISPVRLIPSGGMFQQNWFQLLPILIDISLFSPDVKRQPFVTDVVINTDYDPSRMQDRLFIAPSFPFLRRELESLVKRFGIAVL